MVGGGDALVIVVVVFAVTCKIDIFNINSGFFDTSTLLLLLTNMRYVRTNMRMWTNIRYVRRLQKLHISYPVLISYISRQKFQEYVIPSASITEKNWLTLC